eukprot:403368448
METFEKISDIGKGSFGTVSKIRRKADGKILCWKEMNYGKMSEKEKQLLVNEVNILRELDHPNIVKYYDRILYKEKATIYIVMEYCEKGDMAQLIRRLKRDKEYLPEAKIWKILAQVIYALFTCHRRTEGKKILHRDLKPGNILFDNQGNAKLADFGLSRIMGDQSVFAYTHVGTPYYMSPEQISEQKYNEKSDIWSAGCVIYELASLRAPFEATNQIQLAMKIKNGKFDRIPNQYSDELFRVIQQMMTLDQLKRPSVDEIMIHPQISKNIKENFIKDKYTSIKREEEKIMSNENQIKEKEQEISEKLKQLDDEEKRLSEWEKQLNERLKRLQNNGQINMKEISVEQLDKNQVIDMFQSEEQAKKAKIQAAKNYIIQKQAEECKAQNQISIQVAQQYYSSNDNSNSGQHPQTHRNLICKKDELTYYKKPPMLVKPSQTNRQFIEIKKRPPTSQRNESQEQASQIEIERRKLAQLRANYTNNQNREQGNISTTKLITPRLNNRQHSFDKNTGGLAVPSPTMHKFANQTMGSFDFKKVTNLSNQKEQSQERGVLQNMLLRRPSTHHHNSNSAKNIRNALGDITQKINNKNQR